MDIILYLINMFGNLRQKFCQKDIAEFKSRGKILREKK